MSRPFCFDGVCDCRCNDESPTFDQMLANEAKLDLSLRDLCHSNVGWLTDKSCGDHFIGEWKLTGTEGIYLLWHKNGYCDAHELFHMRSLYVGKGNIGVRLYDHWKNKDFSAEALVYFTYVAMPNRQAKYVEQLLLDLFTFPFNRSESRGTEQLCAYLSQSEVD